MKNQEFNELLEKCDSVENIITLRNSVKAPAYIAACKIKLLKMYSGYVKYYVPVSTLKKYTTHTDCGERFCFDIPTSARGSFKDIAGLRVVGYVVEKTGSMFSNALVLIKTIK